MNGYRRHLSVIQGDPSPLLTPPRGMVRRVLAAQERPRDAMRAEALMVSLCLGGCVLILVARLLWWWAQ